MSDPAVWVIKGGDNNELGAQIKTKGAVAIGWAEVGDVSGIETREQFRNAMESKSTDGAPPVAVGMLYRFVREIQPGDYVLTPERATSRIHISRCVGPYKHDPLVFGSYYPQTRPIEYLGDVPRKYFSVPVRNTLGALLTVFRADNALPFIEAFLRHEAAPPRADPKSELSIALSELEGQVKGQILDALDHFEHYDFQRFIAGLLTALDYKASLGRTGKDGGVDVLAHPDVLGLESPRIKVQTKNQQSTAGISDVGYLNGVLAAGERGLFVCTGGFSRDAQAAPFVASGQIVLVDGARLIELILEHYERLPADATAMLPLKKLYVPVRPVADD